ncbi:hypothetical protein [Endozoicomonas numazuensis]|uniref:hypothetical protein n=1 Tax=Endozoicomonas numazuensis TaxID=1137799 RepID=UPI000557A598|nr:hypothetical protein [Endozoicomonas numazuensis]
MFKFVKDRIVKDWPADIKVALDKGRSKSYPITLDLKILPATQYRDLAAQGDKVVFEEIVQGWSGIHDEDGNELSFSDENRDALADLPAFNQAVVRAYLQASSGEASRKN